MVDPHKKKENFRWNAYLHRECFFHSLKGLYMSFIRTRSIETCGNLPSTAFFFTFNGNE